MPLVNPVTRLHVPQQQRGIGMGIVLSGMAVGVEGCKDVAVLERGLAIGHIGLEPEILIGAREAYLEHGAALEVIGHAASGEGGSHTAINAIGKATWLTRDL